MVQLMNILQQYSWLFFLAFLTVGHSGENCKKLESLSPVEDTVNATVNDWIHFTLRWNPENCSNQVFVVSVDKMRIEESKSVEIFCRFVLNGTSCTSSDTIRTDRCRCETWTDRVNFSTRLEEAGRDVYTWRWSHREWGKGGERQINVYVAAAVETKGYQLQTLTYIMGCVCGLLILTVVLVFISARRLRPDASTVSNRKSQPETPHNFETQGLNSDIQAKSCLQEIMDGNSTLPEKVYSRLSCYRPTPANNQTALTEPIEMTVNELYGDKPF